jgi:NAD(P)-dependent dehydrogenase (short-subunit alcohol dehydrogenase family)
VRKSDQVKNAVDKAIAEFGKIDILVNNAGVLAISPLSTLLRSKSTSLSM